MSNLSNSNLVFMSVSDYLANNEINITSGPADVVSLPGFFRIMKRLAKLLGMNYSEIYATRVIAEDNSLLGATQCCMQLALKLRELVPDLAYNGEIKTVLHYLRRTLVDDICSLASLGQDCKIPIRFVMRDSEPGLDYVKLVHFRPVSSVSGTLGCVDHAILKENTLTVVLDALFAKLEGYDIGSSCQLVNCLCIAFREVVDALRPVLAPVAKVGSYGDCHFMFDKGDCPTVVCHNHFVDSDPVIIHLKNSNYQLSGLSNVKFVTPRKFNNKTEAVEYLLDLFLTIAVDLSSHYARSYVDEVMPESYFFRVDNNFQVKGIIGNGFKKLAGKRLNVGNFGNILIVPYSNCHTCEQIGSNL